MELFIIEELEKIKSEIANNQIPLYLPIIKEEYRDLPKPEEENSDRGVLVLEIL